jgi:type II secretory pathway predicted ATPase ExeA
VYLTIMYEKHFGMRKKLFAASATGSNVFVGPQTVAAMAALKKSLAARDAITTVSGPVGVGKTTMVTRAIESLSDYRVIVRIARMRLGGNDILELLLNELDIQSLPTGTIQRFALFRRRLGELEETDSRVLVLVEDGPRLGADTMAELEALTACDAGESGGANIVLMGDAHLHEFLREPLLARLCQRIRQRLDVGPLSEVELGGYLRHCFRLVGSDFESIFASDANHVLHELSGGIPRIVNNVIASTLAAASNQDMDRVPTNLILEIAAEEYSLTCSDIDTALAEPIEPTSLSPAVDDQTAECPAADPQPQAAPVSESIEIDPYIVFVEDPTDPEPEIEIPELIQDTVPDLAILTPVDANLQDVKAVPAAQPESDLEQPSSSTPADATPEGIHDPTVAELETNFEVLEQAMAATADLTTVTSQTTADKKDSEFVDDSPDSKAIPEITLDRAIGLRLDSKQGDSADNSHDVHPDHDGESGAIPSPFCNDTPAPIEEQADTAIERIAAGLAKARSLEDVDDKMAETLFGEELNLIAAEFRSTTDVDDSTETQADNDSTPVAIAVSLEGDSVGEKHELDDASETTADLDASPVAITVSLEGDSVGEKNGLDVSASQRLRTVRALNADLHPSLRKPQPPTPSVAANDPPPESIEDQMNASLSQTLQILDMNQPGIDNIGLAQEKTGFFSRFKRP